MKKILSLMLVVALVAAFLPALPSAEALYEETREPANYKYVFKDSAHTGTTGSNTTLDTTIHSIKNIVSEVSDPWGFVGHHTSTRNRGLQTDPGNLRMSFNRPGADPSKYCTFTESELNAICLELDVPTGGTFVPSFTISRHNLGPIVELYLIKKPASGNFHSTGLRDYILNDLDPNSRIGIVDAYTSQSAVQTLDRVTIDGGRYYLIMVANGQNVAANAGTNDFQYFLPMSFALDEIFTNAEDVVLDYNLALDKGIDADTDGDGEDTGIPKDTNIPDSTKALTGQGYWTLLAGLFNVEYVSDYTYIDRDYSNNWAYEDSRNRASIYFNSNGVMMTSRYIKSDGDTTNYGYLALKLDIPVAGKYKVSIDPYELDYGGYCGISIFPTTLDVNNANIEANFVCEDYNFDDAAVKALSTEFDEIGTFEVKDAGEYYFVVSLLRRDASTYAGDANDSNPYRAINLSAIRLTGVESPAQAGEEIKKVNPDNATEKTPANTTSNVKILCGVDESVLDTKDVVAGSDVTYIAPEKEGYTFLYWAQGMGTYKKVVSYDAKLSVKAEKGPMWLTAVYADNASEKTDVIFYNANGDEISRSRYNENDVITLATLPAMAGFEKATGWTLDVDGETYTAEDEVKASGKLMRFVAAYPDEPTESYEITVVGGTIDNANPTYGSLVTVTAPAREGGSGHNYFNYWKKGNDIVSFDKTYSFYAWEDCTLTAVYEKYVPIADTARKILVGTRTVGSDTVAVAEFIGVESAVEKGILFGTSIDIVSHKVSMKTDGNTFSVIDDVDGDAIGYAILSDGNVIYSK